MEEMEMVVSDARISIAKMSSQLGTAAYVESADDTKETICAAIRAGEEASERLEDAADFAHYEEFEIAIQESLECVDDAVDSVRLFLSEDDNSMLLTEALGKLAQALVWLNRLAEVEAK